jgi:hypothetical protein
MRRICLLACVALLTGMAPAGAHVLPKEPKAGGSLTQFAYASNIVRIKGADYMILAGATRVTKPTGAVKTTAYAQRSKCATLERKRIKVIACATFVFPHKVPARTFEFDPLMESAGLRLPNGGRPTELTWKGLGTPSPDAAPGADPQYGAFAYAELYRNARADGRLLGVQYHGRHFGAFAILNEGVGADAYQSRGLRIERLPGGALKVRAVYRLPR